VRRCAKALGVCDLLHELQDPPSIDPWCYFEPYPLQCREYLLEGISNLWIDCPSPYYELPDDRVDCGGYLWAGSSYHFLHKSGLGYCRRKNGLPCDELEEDERECVDVDRGGVVALVVHFRGLVKRRPDAGSHCIAEAN
jgi:hypothetical protein